MSNKKQTDHIADTGKMVTSVDWLEERLNLSFGDELKPLRGFFVIAKEMDKQQKIDAYNQGEFNQGCNGRAEQYYKETYEASN